MSDDQVTERIKSDLSENDVVLFMKGSPVFPQCGFSAAVVQVLTTLDHSSVSDSPERRELLEAFLRDRFGIGVRSDG